MDTASSLESNPSPSLQELQVPDVSLLDLLEHLPFPIMLQRALLAQPVVFTHPSRVQPPFISHASQGDSQTLPGAVESQSKD